jgi:ferritin-like metal-binding protein YciE
MAKATKTATTAQKRPAAKNATPQKGTAAKTAMKAASKAAPKKAIPQKRSAGKSAGASEATKLRELFTEELKDLYYAEKLLLKTMPKLAKASTSDELRAAYQQHITETEGQIERLNQVFEHLGMAPRAKRCDAMEGLTKEAQSAIEDTDKGTATRDAALIISSQKAEHYEIASYGSLASLAKIMGETEIAELLRQTLEEEKSTDQKLTQLAESTINIEADSEPE